jgi:hypothetical protein
MQSNKSYMYANKVEKTKPNTEKKKLIFADADVYTIPANEGWNEGYSHSNKFLYITNSGMTGKGSRNTASK